MLTIVSKLLLLQVKEANGNSISKSLSSDTLNSMTTEDDSNSSQKDDSSIRDSDSGVPPMPLRRIKELSEYEDLNENTEITKSKSKDHVTGGDSNAELVGFKANSESKLQMIENEDAIRNDLPSLQKRGEIPAPKRRVAEAASDDSVEEEIEGAGDGSVKRREGSEMDMNFEEKDKYSVRLDDALAKLDELEEEEAEMKDARKEHVKKELMLDSKAKYKINNSEKSAGKSESVKENGKEKGVFDLKAELDQIKVDEKEKVANGDDKSIAESDASSTVTSPKRVSRNG